MALVILGFFREALFVNINGLLYYKYTFPGTEVQAYNTLFQPLASFSYNSLYISKWFITPFFAFIFWFVQRAFLSFLFPEKKIRFWLGVLYLSLLLLAGISFAAGWLAGHLETGYRFSRLFMGLLQSPAPCMILVPLAWFYKQTQTHI